jgi:pimeloyl-ACP methyl ester carboxylesterase
MGHTIYGNADKCIPPAAHAFMARRAKARNVVVVKGASHVVMISHASAVAQKPAHRYREYTP